jgi:hypothetical protein
MQEFAEEHPYFERGQQVTIHEIRRIVAPDNTPDEVENARLRLVGSHLNALLSRELPLDQTTIHRQELKYLGGEALLCCLPGEDLNDN